MLQNSNNILLKETKLWWVGLFSTKDKGISAELCGLTNHEEASEQYDPA